MANSSNFPNSLDSFMEFFDIQEADLPDINQIYALKDKTNKTQDEINTLNQLLTKYRNRMPTAGDFNFFCDCLYNMEVFLKTEITDYIANMKADVEAAQTNTMNTINSTKDSALSEIEQKKENIITYMDSTTAGALRNDLGDPAELTTVNKNDTVDAINEVDNNEKTHEDDFIKHAGVVDDMGVSNAYAITLSSAMTQYAIYQNFRFKALNDNSGASTLNVNDLGAITIKKNKDKDLQSGDILAGQIISVIYDGAYFQLMNNNSLPANGGNSATVAGITFTWGSTKPTLSSGNEKIIYFDFTNGVIQYSKSDKTWGTFSGIYIS